MAEQYGYGIETSPIITRLKFIIDDTGIKQQTEAVYQLQNTMGDIQRRMITPYKPLPGGYIEETIRPLKDLEDKLDFQGQVDSSTKAINRFDAEMANTVKYVEDFNKLSDTSDKALMKMDDDYTRLASSTTSTQISMEKIGNTIITTTKIVDQFGNTIKENTKEVTKNWQQFQFWTLGLMFFGIQLQRTFGKAWTQMSTAYYKITENTTALGQANLRLSASMTFLQVSIMTALEPALIPLIEAVISLLDWFEKLPEPIKEVAGLFIVGGMFAGAILNAVGGVLSFTVNTLPQLTKALTGPGGVTDEASKASQALSALGKVISIGIGFYYVYDALKEFSEGDFVSGLEQGLKGAAFIGLATGRTKEAGALLAISAAITLGKAMLAEDFRSQLDIALSSIGDMGLMYGILSKNPYIFVVGIVFKLLPGIIEWGAEEQNKLLESALPSKPFANMTETQKRTLSKDTQEVMERVTMGATKPITVDQLIRGGATQQDLIDLGYASRNTAIDINAAKQNWNDLVEGISRGTNPFAGISTSITTCSASITGAEGKTGLIPDFNTLKTTVNTTQVSYSTDMSTMTNNTNNAVQAINKSLNSIPKKITTTHTIITENVTAAPKLPTTPNPFYKPTAKGGIIKSPQIRLVGEAGPEAIIPLDRLNNIGQQQATSNNVSIGDINIDITTGPVNNDIDVKDLANKVSDEIMKDIRNYTKYVPQW